MVKTAAVRTRGLLNGCSLGAHKVARKGPFMAFLSMFTSLFYEVVAGELYSSFDSGNLDSEEKKKVDCRRQCVGFCKGFGNFFLDGLDIGRFRIAKDAMSPYQSTF